MIAYKRNYHIIHHLERLDCSRFLRARFPNLTSQPELKERYSERFRLDGSLNSGRKLSESFLFCQTFSHLILLQLT
jgi:hypothetical protein